MEKGITGPIASSLSEKFGHRAVGITGSIVAATGFGVSSLAPNLSLLYLTYGVLTGLGFGMMFFQSIVSVQDHFEKRKSLAMGVAVCGSGLVVLHIYIPDIARDVGIGVNKAAFLLSIVGVANTVARIVMGAFADFRCANRRYMLGASIMVRGVIVSMLPSLTGYNVIATVCGFYGLTVGTTISLVPVVLRDLVGIEKLGPSFGLTMVAVGLGSLLLSTGGSLYDLTGSYDLTLYITGSLLFIAGGTIMSLPWVRKMQNRCCYHGSASITAETEP
ncbi:monocarboxylate transporter 9-like [Lingula anatina]|uniref:Monocarboxylate transporter 9-like n=1 Tax=Lingula anatina TaxID=7574 RepID=A0A1S3IRU5_LINAN|nr:monocarboxylate transporter 9-like [Lingula anatina]|eukprot:XP_013400935.1 monocarboxylate transporter 9-like [Lingula anatina]